MLERFANVVYYIFVALAVFVFVNGVRFGLDDRMVVEGDSYAFSVLFYSFWSLPVFGIGWSIRYILTGKKSFF
jgi:hypothetical protein